MADAILIHGMDRLELGTAKDKYGLSQEDFYQMAAYGERYLKGSGDMFLIYPRSPQFNQHLPPFVLSPDLRLWLVPFDLESEKIDLPQSVAVGLAHGELSGQIVPTGGFESRHPMS